MTSKEEGLIPKFWVGRTDYSDDPGGPKEDARYFTLDYVHDPLARKVIEAYAAECTKAGFSLLANDLWQELRDTAELARKHGSL